MKDRFIFSQHNFCLIDFYSVYSNCEPNLISCLDSYGLLKPNRKMSKDAKLLIMHHTILQICEYVLQYKGKEKNVIYYTSAIPDYIQLSHYYDNLGVFFDKLISQLQKALPIRVHKNHIPYSYVIRSEQGEREEIVARIKTTIDELDFSNFSFSKTNAYTKRYNLSFLNKEYFKSLKTKQLLLT